MLQKYIQAGKKKKTMVVLDIFYPKSQNLLLSPWQTFTLHFIGQNYVNEDH